MRRTILLTLIAVTLVAMAMLGSQARTRVAAGDLGTGGVPVPPAGIVTGRAATGAPVQLSAALTYDHLLRSGDGRVQLAVAASAPAVEQRTRFPLHIALVLDRSGSMAGEKLAQARQAARDMIRRLGGDDRLAIIAYDNVVDVLMPLTPVATRRAELLAAVESLSDRGSTNLGGGLAEGIQALQHSAGEHALCRVILISDGRANEGETNPATLGGWVEQARRQSISVSTMGVGLDYNEDLLMALADHGGGSYHYVEGAAALAGIFGKEIDGLFTTVAREMVLEVQPAPGVVVERVYGFTEERDAGRVSIPFGDLPAGDRRSAVLALALPHATPGLLPVVEVRLRYRDAQADGKPRQEAVRLQAAITDDPLLVQRGEDRPALEQAETARAADTARAALDLYEQGRVAEASRMARQHAGDLDRLGQRLQSKAVQQQSQLLNQLDLDINAAPASSVAGKGLLKKGKSDAWVNYGH